MSSDPLQTQRDSALLLPRLKFLWESYRAVLDILRSNSKLERLYHNTAVGALRFCGAYKRRTEFRRLCDMLRMHLGNLQKYGGVNAAAIDEGKQNSKVSIHTHIHDIYLLKT
jgi:translation initiation factor 3 subunit A